MCPGVVPTVAAHTPAYRQLDKMRPGVVPTVAAHTQAYTELDKMHPGVVPTVVVNAPAGRAQLQTRFLRRLSHTTISRGLKGTLPLLGKPCFTHSPWPGVTQLMINV